MYLYWNFPKKQFFANSYFSRIIETYGVNRTEWVIYSENVSILFVENQHEEGKSA